MGHTWGRAGGVIQKARNSKTTTLSLHPTYRWALPPTPSHAILSSKSRDAILLEGCIRVMASNSKFRSSVYKAFLPVLA